MNGSYVDDLKFMIYLLKMEVDALRSVLSEFEGDKTEFTQWHKAQAIDELKNHLKPID